MITLSPAKPAGTIAIPASKSQTIRAFLIAYFAHDISRISNPLISEDTKSCINAISNAGAKVMFSDDMSSAIVDSRNIVLPDNLTIDAGGNRQKLKSYFINEKVPEDQRGRIPLIADGPEIAWIPGYRMGRTYYVDDSTERILEIKITEEKTNGDNQGTDPGRESR